MILIYSLLLVRRPVKREGLAWIYPRAEYGVRKASIQRGSYNSSLTAAYYQELLNLLEKAKVEAQARSSGEIEQGASITGGDELRLPAYRNCRRPGNGDSFNYPLSACSQRN